jgi:hypothetical protein
MQRMDGKMIGGPVEPGKPTTPTPEQPVAPSEQDDFEDTSPSTVDINQFMPQLKPKRLWLRVLKWIFFVLVAVAIVGGGVYWYVKNHKSATPKTSQSSQQHSSQSQSAPQENTKRYTSANFNLSFSYPQNWTVTDTGKGKLTVNSPAMQLKGADGQSQNGQVVMAIQNENTYDFTLFKAGSAVAVLNSQKLAYSNPSPTQRANTYISFLQYASTTTHGALDGIYVTGDFGYQKDQTIPESDIQKVDPVITVTFNQCQNAGCSGTVKPMNISSSQWSDSSFATQISKMIESLAIQ